MRVRQRCLILLVPALVAVGCRKAPVHTSEVVAMPSAEVPLDPNASPWQSAPVHAAKLLLQDLVEPRLMTPSTSEVQVRALTNGSEIAFRLEWADSTASDLAKSSHFVDSCAVQIPRKIEPSAPDPQMGQEGRPVDIVFWRADWQAWVNGRKDTIREVFPNATVDHYPFDAKPLEAGSAAHKEMAKRYAPAEAVGNRRIGPREFPVEDMVAEGPGTLSPAPATRSRGQGVRTKEGWTVVLRRPLPEGLVARARTQVAFAVWEGSHNEVGARKMRTGWISLLREEQR